MKSNLKSKTREDSKDFLLSIKDPSCFSLVEHILLLYALFLVSWDRPTHCIIQTFFFLVLLRKNTVSTASKIKKPSQSSVLKEGQPLPANGTCKHYKKSYRWLRLVLIERLESCKALVQLVLSDLDQEWYLRINKARCWNYSSFLKKQTWPQTSQR